MATGRAGSKELSAFADQFILSECQQKVKHYFTKMLEFLRFGLKTGRLAKLSGKN